MNSNSISFIVLTGGTSKRFGSDKSKAKIGDETLLEFLCRNLPKENGGRLIIVGPESSVNAKYVREVPPGSGPLAAIGSGLKEVDSQLVGIFATDMPFAPKIIPQLTSALADDAALPLDEEGQIQPLAGIYRSAALKSALATYESLANQSVKSLLEKLKINQVPLVETELLLDIDTEAALSKAIALQSRLGL